MAKKNKLVLMNGEGAMTVEGMERIYRALTGKDFAAAARVMARKKTDAQKAKSKKPQ